MSWTVCVATDACASSRDALRADSDLRAYGPCHRRDGTAGTPELLPKLPQPDLGTISDDYGPAAICWSMDLAAAAGPARLARVDYGPAMQLADEDRSDAVRRDRRLRDRRERADASGRSTGLGEHCKSTRRGMRWVFIILTSRSFFLGKPSRSSLGAKPMRIEEHLQISFL